MGAFVVAPFVARDPRVHRRPPVEPVPALDTEADIVVRGLLEPRARPVMNPAQQQARLAGAADQPRTDDGCEVVFRHDEIRDWHDNIRLDYGYALTIASAQGLTVDRVFLLTDGKPARETIYPAATRHREGLDIYVNRAPLTIDIAERRPEDRADRPVMDADIRSHLADRWSRSQPKEAALDYITDGAWRDRREKAARQEKCTRAGERPGSAANDNAIVRIAGEIRHTALGWRHGAAVDALAAGREAVLAEYGAHRARISAGDDAVALSPAFGQTLDRHAALLKVAEPFRARPRTLDRLLAERGGSAARSSTPSRPFMTAQAATAARPPCGTCIGSGARPDWRRHVHRGWRLART